MNPPETVSQTYELSAVQRLIANGVGPLVLVAGTLAACNAESPYRDDPVRVESGVVVYKGLPRSRFEACDHVPATVNEVIPAGVNGDYYRFAGRQALGLPDTTPCPTTNLYVERSKTKVVPPPATPSASPTR